MILVAGGLLIAELGWPAVIGLFMLVCVLPIVAFLGLFFFQFLR